MNKKLSLLIFSILVVIIVLIVLSIYLRSNRIITESDTQNIEKYITAYTEGTVQKQSTIKVKFTNEFTEKIDKKVDLNDVLRSYPNIKGETYWLNDNTMEFSPSEKLESDTEYAFKVALHKLSKVPVDLKAFTFQIKVIKQNFEAQITGLKSINNKTLKWQRINGIIQFADYEDIVDIQRMFSVKGGNYQPEVRKIADFKYNFQFDSVPRKEDGYVFTIHLDGNKIGMNKEEDLPVEIPALGEFKFISYGLIQQPEQYLQLQFSDPLDEDQLLSGLIRLGDLDDLKYVISDNIVHVYTPYRIKGNYDLVIEKGVKNILGYPIKDQYTEKISFEEIKPAVRFIGSGNLLPVSNGDVLLPFEAVNLSAVDVRIIQIYENNITQFLQDNNYDGTYRINRVGKTIVQETVPLNKSEMINQGTWNRFSLNLNDLIDAESGAIYNISIGFRKKHSLFNCEAQSETDKNIPDDDKNHWNTFDNYWYGDYDWEHRDDPCYGAYYGSRRIASKNILVTNIAITAKKQNNDSIRVFVNDIISTDPIQNAKVTAYNYQQQEILDVNTNNDGIINIPAGDVYFIVAKDNKQKTYLTINDGNSLSLSNFDVSGASVKKGLKAYLFAERDVWRPGDTLFISLMLEENAEKLPLNHPLLFELYNPQNQLVQKLQQFKNDDNLYTFKAKTSVDDPTGMYHAIIKIGGLRFSKRLRIETVRPNRLKIMLNFNRDYLTGNTPISGNLKANWLHGAPGKDLLVKCEYVLKPARTVFEQFKDYDFTDRTKRMYAEKKQFFETKTNQNGWVDFSEQISIGNEAPGLLNTYFTTRVFEKGGGFSINQFSIPLHPYESYLGIKVEGIKEKRDMLETDTSHTVHFILADKEGTLLPESHKLDIKVYKLDWRWWWDNSYDNIANYSGRIYRKPVHKSSITTKAGKGIWKFRINYPEWGRFLIKATDEKSGHSVSKIIYLDWPGWISRDNKDFPLGATMLTFTADKEEYNIGEDIHLNIPSAEGGRALISIENGTKVVKSFWVNTTKENTSFSFKADNEMTPNVYVNVSLIQPHEQAINDLPVRLYGILSLKIYDKESKLAPVLDMPDELRAETEFTISVTEKNKKKMSYVIAIVDEGLLDLTNFKTPEPWNYFNAREALGVKTWDSYDWVIGSFSGEFGRLLSIGGDEESKPEGERKASRFEPVVKFIGPFSVGENKSNKHRVTLPPYIGSVRTMIIAKSDNAYGSADKTTPVTKPLMLLASLPRVLGPEETVRMQVDVFTMQENLNKVEVKVETNDLLAIDGENSKTIKFTETGEKSTYFDLKVNAKTGIATIQITASSGREKSVENIEIDVRNPNLPITKILTKVLEPGDNWQAAFSPIGIIGTNKAKLEVTTVPPLNLEKRINYLIRYPFGCIEQTTSAAFPLLYIGKLIDLDEAESDYFGEKIEDAIGQIKSFQRENGGFTYWPNSRDTDPWCTSYAGHFLLEAEQNGYALPQGIIAKWTNYQQRKAQRWTDDGNRSQLIQAYRLYTLALAGKPEISAMNQLREKTNSKSATKWRLAAAYELAGKTRIAERLVENLTTDVIPYNESYYTYGSDIRDKALILETLVLLDNKKEAFNIISQLSDKLSSNQWLSTQTLAYSLLSISKYYKENDPSGKIEFEYNLNKGKNESIVSGSVIHQVEIPMQFSLDQIIDLTNKGDDLLHASIILEGIPATGDIQDEDNHMKMQVNYKLLDGTKIDPVKLQQGVDFIAEVSVTYLGKTNIMEQFALKQVFPSGWEIFNTRLFENTEASNSYDIPDYRNIRDDRVYTFFNLRKGKTKTFSVQLNSGYQGKYYMPVVYVEAMYDGTINSSKHGYWVEVIPNQ